MRSRVIPLLLTLMMMSCSKDGATPEHWVDYDYGRSLSHDRIVLGKRLENPYKTENVTKALMQLYPTKADRVQVEPTDLYVRFLPADRQECDYLKTLGLELVDHPLDYDIAVDGDWYHDPEVPEDNVTWQYAVVPVDFEFPDGIEYEIIHECHIMDTSSQTKSDGIDWTEVERQAYILTGNEERLDVPQTRAGEKISPSGRITVVDEHANGGKPFGVSGVRISCNSFVKFDRTYTDRDGYYKMTKKFNTKLRYRLVFQNEKGFALGMNLILVPASVSTLGKAAPSGVNMTVTSSSDGKLFRRCVVNNAAYDYYSRCSEADLGLKVPPADLRIWMFKSLKASSAIMLHHGSVLSNKLIAGYLGSYAAIIKFLLPDVTIGVSGREDYRSLYSVVCHELAHASHFAKVGTSYWNKYIWYIMESYITSGGMTYGDGSSADAGYCEVGEMWAYYMESRMYNDRYGGIFPTFGSSHWFYPQIFHYLGERGMTPGQIYAVLGNDVTDRNSLKSALIKAYPSRKNLIEQAFSRY